jgi:hypothetical protein
VRNKVSNVVVPDSNNTAIGQIVFGKKIGANIQYQRKKNLLWEDEKSGEKNNKIWGFLTPNESGRKKLFCL